MYAAAAAPARSRWPPTPRAPALAGAGATWLLLQGVKRLVDRPRRSRPTRGDATTIAEPQDLVAVQSPGGAHDVLQVAARELRVGRLGRWGSQEWTPRSARPASPSASTTRATSRAAC